MKWITREYVSVDRTACAWLIRKFVDERAEFIFVPVEQIQEVAKKEEAIPYDAPAVELGHHGDKVSFDAIAEKYKITDPAVLELAKIVRAVDTHHPEESREGPGLRALIDGIVIAAKDDHEAVAKTSQIYDALYTNCKLKVIREKYKKETEKMDKGCRTEFLKRRLAD